MMNQRILLALKEFAAYHLISFAVIAAIFCTIMIHYHGSRVNRRIVERYRQILNPLLSSWFRKNDEKLIYESPNIVKMYPSDRDSCLFAIISFALVPRQQLLSFLFNPIIFKLKDELVIEIPINNQFPLSLTAAIIRKKQIKTITKKSFPDVKQLCKEYRAKALANAQNKPEDFQSKFNLPDTHSLLIQKIEHMRYFLHSEKETATWLKHGKSVKLVYISDVNKFSRYPMAVRMVINLNERDIPPMLEWLMSFIDRIAKVRMSQGERKEALKKRQTLDIKYD